MTTKSSIKYQKRYISMMQVMKGTTNNCFLPILFSSITQLRKQKKNANVAKNGKHKVLFLEDLLASQELTLKTSFPEKKNINIKTS